MPPRYHEDDAYDDEATGDAGSDFEEGSPEENAAIDRALKAAGLAGSQMAKRGIPVRRRKNQLVFLVEDEEGPLGVEVVVDLKPADYESRQNAAPGSTNPSNAALADSLARAAASRTGVPMTRIVAREQHIDRFTRRPQTVRYIFTFAEE
jgi:hypothetical protein